MPTPADELKAAADQVHRARTVQLGPDGAAGLATLLARQAYYAQEYEGTRGADPLCSYDPVVLDALAVARQILGSAP
jgi:hypothetical protein